MNARPRESIMMLLEKKHLETGSGNRAKNENETHLIRHSRVESSETNVIKCHACISRSITRLM